MIGKGNDCLFPLYLPIENCRDKLRVRCGHCINCKAHKAREWCMRLEMESHYWSDMCFVTLTYSDEYLPRHLIDGHIYFTDEEIGKNPELALLSEPTHNPDHLTLFLKRLRKRLETPCRYFAVGEYGTRYGRSHLHILFFGIPAGAVTQRLMEKCWTYGFVQVKPFFKETCTYIAGYVQKKLYGKEKYLFKLPEFMRCSHHLGERWLLDNISSIDDEHPYINIGGYKYGLPRQFRKILVSKGKLKEISLLATALIQKQELKTLYEDLDFKDVSYSEFWRHRIKTAVEKQKRKLNSRNKTGDI